MKNFHPTFPEITSNFHTIRNDLMTFVLHVIRLGDKNSREFWLLGLAV